MGAPQDGQHKVSWRGEAFWLFCRGFFVAIAITILQWVFFCHQPIIRQTERVG
jgi:hypothetical protein